MEFSEILHLQEIALLGEQDDIRLRFIEIVTDIHDIVNILNKISTKGYYKVLNYKIIIENGCSFEFNQNSITKRKEKELKAIINELNGIEEACSRFIKSTYLTNSVTRLIHGRQFYFIYEFIRNNFNIDEMDKNVDKNVLINILKYVTYAKLLNENNTGIYSHECSVENIEIDTIYCCLCLTGHFPIAQTILNCNEETSENEIISFVYRSIKCETNTLFIIMKPDKLKLKNKNLLIELIRGFLGIKHQKKLNSCLLFIYNKNNIAEEVIVEIRKLSNNKIYNLKKNEILFKKFPKVEIYSSDLSGLGKSTKIKRDFDYELGKEKYKYVYFPIGGDIKKSEIIKRLLKLTKKDRVIGLHLDLHYSKQIDLIKEFLFSFLILKYYSQNENIFYYGNEIRIKVELPNGYINYMNLFPILDFFENLNIKKNQLQPFI
ncbi:hypothetical protein BCR36DRAFT_303669, partial [Piromyces finnis]